MKKSNALMLATMLAITNPNYRQELIDLENERKNKPIKKIIPKGLKAFFYGEKEIDGTYKNVVYALNKKNADRKAKKLGFI